MSNADDIFDKIEENIQQHTDTYHAFTAVELKAMVVQHQELVDAVPVNKRLLERVIDVLDGTPEYDLHGEPIGRQGGMVVKQSQIERDVADLKFAGNGGRGFSVRTRDKIIIGLIAAIPSIALLLAAIFSGNTP